MKYGSVCSGIEAASVAWHQMGWKAAWLAEIEPFPSAVLDHHYPDVQNLGDMTAIASKILSMEVEAPDVLVGGTPCQAFSIAGLRNSLDDNRGQLSISFIHLADSIDTVRRIRGEQPAIVVWENVPGVLSTKDNAFGCFLAGLAGEECELQPSGKRWTDAGCVYGPKRTVAWRILDAKYFGLAQRRRRVFVVASARDRFDPCTVLFERDGMRRDSAPSRESRQVAPTIPSRSLGGGGLGTDFDCDGGVIIDRTGSTGDGLARCVTAGEAKRQDWETCNFVATAFDTTQITSAANRSNPKQGDPCHPLLAGDHAPAIAFDLVPTLTSNGDAHSGYRDEKGLIPISASYGMQASIIGRQVHNGGNGLGFSEEVAPTMTKVDQHGVVSVALRGREGGATAELGGEQAGTLRASGGGGDKAHVLARSQVRRLTPVECARLQGFPDDYLDITFRNKPAADGNKYKALGNSMAVPVMAWIGRRIGEALA